MAGFGDSPFGNTPFGGEGGTPTPAVTVNVALTGTGTLTASRSVAVTRPASLTGTGALTASSTSSVPTPSVTVNAALTGLGQLTAATSSTTPPAAARSPLSIPGAIRWATAEDAAVKTDGAITGLVDRVSGFTYEPGSIGPVYRAAGIGGRPSLEWTASNANAVLIEQATPPLGSEYAFWAVAYRTGGGANAILLALDTASAGGRVFQLGYATTNTARSVGFYGSGSTRLDAGPSFVAADAHLHIGQSLGSTVETFTDGNTNGATTTGTGAATGTSGQRLVVGRGDVANSNYNYVGQIAEWGTYDHALTPAERATLDSYVQDKYGIAVADYVPPPATTAPAVTVNAPLTGTGTLTATASSSAPAPSVTVNVTLTGTGTLTAARSATLTRSGTLTGTGTLTATSSSAAQGSVSASLTGTGTLTATVSGISVTRTVALTGTGTLAGRVDTGGVSAFYRTRAGTWAPLRVRAPGGWATSKFRLL